MREWSTLRKLMLMQGATGVPLTEYTATGNPLSFNTNLAKPLKSLLIPWTPVQSGIGNPYPPGGGKNKLDPAKKDIQFANNIYYYKEDGLILPAGTYTLSIGISCSRIVTDYETNVNIATTYNDSPNTFTLAEEKKVYFNFYKSGGIDHDANGQLEVGSSATSFVPYSNIRPISGVSALNVCQTGKNLAQFAPVVMAQDRKKNGIKFHAVNKSLVHISGEASANTYLTEGQIETDLFLKAGKYTLSTNLPNDSTSRVYLYSKDATISYHAAYNEHPATITLANDTPNVNVQIMVNSGAEIDTDVWVMLVPGETASSYEPYSCNSYPVVFPALGRNLFNKDDEAVTTGVWWKGRVLTGGAYDSFKASNLIPVVPGETYRLTRTTTGQSACCYFDSSKTYVNQENWDSYNPSRTIPEGVYYFAFTVNADAIDSAMFEKGSTQSSYEPYTNTVYGGSLDLVTGVLTATHKGVDIGSELWNYSSSSTPKYFNHVFDDRKKGAFNSMCSVFKLSSTSGTSNLGDNSIVGSTVNGNVFIRCDSLSDASSLSTEYKGQIIVYELDTPLTYQLTPEQISTLLGDNVIWTDTNGSNTAVYLKKG